MRIAQQPTESRLLQDAHPFGVLLHDPSGGPSGVVVGILDYLYYTLTNPIIFTNFRLHLTLRNHPQT